MITTEAWVLRKGPTKPEPGHLIKTTYNFPDLTPDEVLAEPIYGCWEANMTHALQRDPIDVCRYRGEAEVVLGNAGVVRVLKTGSAVTHLKTGDLCVLTSLGELDEAGYPLTIVGYDAPNSMGVLAKHIKSLARQLFPIPADTPHTLQQWAAFPIRYGTAWDNWQVAYGAWQLQMKGNPCYVWGWGGGVSLGELLLAKRAGCQTAMIASTETRLTLIESFGITPIDRRNFADLAFDPALFKTDFAYRRRYMQAELAFLEIVKEHTNGAGVSIFIDNLGGPVFRATLKALGRQGVITTSGWKAGLELAVARGTECINRHIHVHTHGSYNSDEAFQFAEKHGWLPPVDTHITPWDEIPELAEAYQQGQIESYFPLFQVNSL